jgi:hypothetical protein
MNRFLVTVLKMPLKLFVASLDLFLGTVRDFQAAFNEAADSVLTEPGPLAVPGASAASPAEEAGETSIPRPGPGRHKVPEILPSEKEIITMTDQDLGGDDAKNISFWITFVKPDFVATLQAMQTETIDYATDAGSYGGLKIGEFMTALAARPLGIPYPTEWAAKTLPTGYATAPPQAPGVIPLRLLGIPPMDRKYIKFNYKVNWRQPVPEAEREKEKIEVLREIRDRL